MSPGERGDVPVRLIRESSMMLVAPIPFDDERNVPLLLLLERVDVGRAPCGSLAKSKENISYSVLHGRLLVQLRLSQLWAQCCFKSNLKSPIMLDRLHLGQVVDVLGQHLESVQKMAARSFTRKAEYDRFVEPAL